MLLLRANAIRSVARCRASAALPPTSSARAKRTRSRRKRLAASLDVAEAKADVAAGATVQYISTLAADESIPALAAEDPVLPGTPVALVVAGTEPDDVV